jgi:hypothetical protein
MKLEITARSIKLSAYQKAGMAESMLETQPERIE